MYPLLDPIDRANIAPDAFGHDNFHNDHDNHNGHDYHNDHDYHNGHNYHNECKNYFAAEGEDTSTSSPATPGILSSELL